MKAHALNCIHMLMMCAQYACAAIVHKQLPSVFQHMDASSRNGTLGMHPTLHPPKWESLENVFQKVLNINFLKHFSYFFNEGV